MSLLLWDDDSSSLREGVEGMRQGGAIAEIVGVALTSEGRHDEFEEDIAHQLVLEAGGMVQALGRRALKLLDAQAAPGAPTPIRPPRVRTARRRAA